MSGSCRGDFTLGPCGSTAAALRCLIRRCPVPCRRWEAGVVEGVNSQDRAPQYDRVPLVKSMRLTLAYHLVTDIRFGATTQLQGTTLEISEAALRQHLLEDCRL